jgi:hypothetical protein
VRKTANARIADTDWDETPYGEGPGLPNLTHADVTKTWPGDRECSPVSEKQLRRARRDRQAVYPVAQVIVPLTQRTPFVKRYYGIYS